MCKLSLAQNAWGAMSAGEALGRQGGRLKGHQDFDLLVEVLKTGAFGKDMPPNPWLSW